MDHIANLLRLDVSKYRDIFNILSKLEEEGAVKEISHLFEKIFTNESKFTLEELAKMNKERSDKINIDRQYENNLSLFKNNFRLIVDLLIENIYKTIANEHQNNISEKTLLKSSDNPANNIGEEPISSRVSEKASIAKTYQSPKKVSKINISEKSSPTNTEKSRPKNRKKSSQLNKLVGDSYPKTSREYTSGEKEKPHTVQSQQYSLNSKRFSTQASQNNLSLTGGQTLVCSDFNSVQGSATFSQSKRKFLDLNLNGPGPAFYDVEKASPSHLRRSISPTIGKAVKRTWAEIASKTASPGPGGLYPLMKHVAK